MNKKELLNKLKKEGFSENIILAFKKVPREKFIPKEASEMAYEDVALPIGVGQTISQPYTIAFMLSLLELEDGQKVMEVGSGSGYVLALLSVMFRNFDICGVERIKKLLDKSRIILKDYKNVKIQLGDGSKGFIEKSPYDRILVSASVERIPNELIEQLSEGGILVIPVKNSIIKICKTPQGIEKKEFPGFIFVRLVVD